MKLYGEVDVWIHIFLTYALVALVHAQAALLPGEEPPVPIG
jgi:hypothetical protein